MASVYFLFGTLFIFSPVFFAVQFIVFLLAFISGGYRATKYGLIFITIAIISLLLHEINGVVDKIYIFTIVCCFYALTVPSIYANCKKAIGKDGWRGFVNFCIKFHIITFLLQFFAFKLFNIDIDYGKLLLGPPHRSSYDGFDYRATGVFAEPSIFSIHMLTLLVMKYILENKNSIMVYIALACMAISGSTFSVICVALFFILTIKFTIKWVVGGVATFFVLSPIVYENILWRMSYVASGNDGSTSYKLNLLKTLYEDATVFNIGHGMVGYYENAPDYLQSLFDMTLFGSNILVFGFWLGGVLSIIWVTYFIRFQKISLRMMILCLLPCLKLTFLFPIFWLYLAFLAGYFGGKNEKY
ncbi:polymerase [Buttiauxella sp. A111]|uniref:polymerase n=1 Tax=Buttiauxella sp. A111 TaxID=2563088 RepID=UPI0010F1CC23|nr:polymerase [Buttiauxella sp. A111]GDX04563.1 hypothetical protein BSPA111_07310 [Buttiauxella sp. A111]